MLSENRGQATPANSSVHEKRQDVQFVVLDGRSAVASGCVRSFVYP